MGPQATPYQEIAAWARLTGVRLVRWEVECLRDLDTIRLVDLVDGGKSGAPPVTEAGDLDRAAVVKQMERAFDFFG